MADKDLERLLAGKSRPRQQQERPADRAQRVNEESPGEGYRAGPDLDRMPKGYDPDIWHLAQVFMERAEAYEVELEVSVYRTYALLLRRIGKTRLRTRNNWVQVVEMMITSFWDDEVDTGNEAWAITQFVGVETFKGLARQVLMSLASDDTTEWRTERLEGASALGERRRAARKARQLRTQPEDDDEMRELRARARAKVAEAMKEFAE